MVGEMNDKKLRSDEKETNTVSDGSQAGRKRRERKRKSKTQVVMMEEGGRP